MKLDETGKLLVKAAKLIERRGWTQHEYECDKGFLCMLGSLRRVQNVNSDLTAPVDRLALMLGVRWPSDWNDAVDRTPEEVIDCLIAAAYWELK